MNKSEEYAIIEIIEKHLNDLKLSGLEGMNKSTIEFLMNLREQDIIELQNALDVSRKIKTVSIFMKWLLISSIAVFLSFVSLWEGILKIKGKIW